jgi:outer membrane protein assembly factor BamA
MFSCSTTKYVPKNRYLLTDTKIKIHNTNKKYEIKKSDIEPLVRQKANTRFLSLFKFQLWLYNLSSSDTSQWFNNWIRRLGENPAIYDPFITDQTKQQINLYLFQKGYFNSFVKDSVKIKKQKITLFLDVYPGNPKFIGKINYIFEDSALKAIVLSDSSNIAIRSNDILTLDALQNEQVRIETLLRNRGFFTFTRDHVLFQLDTLSDNEHVNIFVNIKYDEAKNREGNVYKINHQRYKLGNVQVWVDKQRTSDTLNYRVDSIMYDIITIDSTSYFYRDFISIRPNVLHDNILLKKGSLYRQQDVEETYNRLSALKLFKFINIGFVENKDDTTDRDSIKTIDCKIQLSLLKYQSFQVEGEVTNRIGIGVAGNFNYQHRNIFRGGEVFNFKVNGNTETVKSTKTFQFKNTMEFGLESGFALPKLLVPFVSSYFGQEYTPRTTFSGSYNFLRRIQYTNQIFNTSYGINWNNRQNSSFQINILDINYIKILQLDSSFYQSITNTFLRNSFQNHFLLLSAFNYTFNNQHGDKKVPFEYFKIGIELAGNSTRLLMNSFNAPKTVDGYYELLGIKFAQYAKTDLDFRYYLPVKRDNKLVMRALIGIAYPYGNSSTVPFEKEYFAGGANSIRAWQLRSLGPGGYKDTITVAFPDKTGDIKLEANIELRFKMFWKFEGALFIDAGNIWSVNKDENRADAKFQFNTFYQQIAIGTGIGLRLNFSFFILRFDVGLKVRDPSKLPYPYVINNSHWASLINPTIGIGYPF